MGVVAKLCAPGNLEFLIRGGECGTDRYTGNLFGKLRVFFIRLKFNYLLRGDKWICIRLR
jgi:hypothetical protein